MARAHAALAALLTDFLPTLLSSPPVSAPAPAGAELHSEEVRESGGYDAAAMGRNRSPRLKARVLVERDGQVLLVRHAKRKQKAFWCLPGGNADPGESLAQAARRELLEETGVDVEIEGAVLILDGPEAYAGDGGAVEVILRGTITTGEPGPTTHTGDPYLDRIEWFPLDDLPVSFRPRALADLLRQAGSAAALPLIPIGDWIEDA